MKDMTKTHFDKAQDGVNHPNGGNGLNSSTGAKAGMGKVPDTGPGGREIPGDAMPGTQRAYPPLSGNMGGEAAFGFGMKRPR